MSNKDLDMKYQEIIEKVHFHFPSKYSPSEEVMIYKNPSHREFVQIINKLPYQELRGVTNNNVVYIWGAHLALHDEIIALIDNQVDIGKFMIDGDTVYSADEIKDDDYFQNHRMLNRMLGKV